MLEFSDILVITLLAAMAHFWWKTMQAREQAVKLARDACARENVQLLDATVALKKLSWEKAPNGRRYGLRYFGFEFSCDGTDRREGYIALHGLNKYSLVMDLPVSEGVTIEEMRDGDD
ncbi:MAG: DUF3301 domain-containing protein [Gammaproteobacteria bacterium]|nr:DUF3301 domain-containing protein [Gammaproteobacteria bacterium]